MCFIDLVEGNNIFIIHIPGEIWGGDNLHYVYVDLLLLINIVMNYILLHLTATLSQVRYTPWRLGAGSLLGGIYALAVLLSTFPWLQGPLVKVLISLAMVLISLGMTCWLNLLRRLAYFYFLSFLIGGATLFLLYFAPTTSKSVSWWFLLAAVTVSTGLGYLVWNHHSLYKWEQNKVITRLRFDTTWVQVPALVDTGNRLCDPCSLNPVIVIEASALIAVLPPELRGIFKPDGVDLKGITDLEDTGWAKRCRIIPFSSLGQEKGLLLGIRPDEVCFLIKDRWERSKPTLIGVANRDFPGNYRALIPPALF